MRAVALRVIILATSAGHATIWPTNPKPVTPRHHASALKRRDRHRSRRVIQVSPASSASRIFPEGENAKPARSHDSGRIGRPAKATTLEGELTRPCRASVSSPRARCDARARGFRVFPPA